MSFVKRAMHAVARRILFHPLERYCGLHLMPAHYYSPVPTVSEIDPEVFEKPFAAVGVDWNEPQQHAFLRNVLPRYVAEYEPTANSGLSLMDALVLYAMIRERRPKLMVEIGSGESTKVAAAALRANRDANVSITDFGGGSDKDGVTNADAIRAGQASIIQSQNARLIAVEPYPSAELRRLEGVELIVDKVQNVPLDRLTDADIVFIDSSHVSKIGSDVNYEILDIVPRVKVGALVHWHDIVMPRNYWREWINGGMFWNESYMVHAFMLFNERFKIRWAAQYMQSRHFAALQAAFPRLEARHRLTSFWVERVS